MSEIVKKAVLTVLAYREHQARVRMGDICRCGSSLKHTREADQRDAIKDFIQGATIEPRPIPDDASLFCSMCGKAKVIKPQITPDPNYVP